MSSNSLKFKYDTNVLNNSDKHHEQFNKIFQTSHDRFDDIFTQSMIEINKESHFDFFNSQLINEKLSLEEIGRLEEILEKVSNPTPSSSNKYQIAESFINKYTK
jgi:hypothetical protein